MNVVKTLSKVRNFDFQGVTTCYHGTTCELIDDKGRFFIRKTFAQDDWRFKRKYRFEAELITNRIFSANGLRVPEIIRSDKAKNCIDYQYLEGAVNSPDKFIANNDDEVFIQYTKNLGTIANIRIPNSPQLRVFGDTEVHFEKEILAYKLSKLGIFNSDELMAWASSLSQSLSPTDFILADYDSLLGNSLIYQDKFVFTDFEWAMYLPIEFVLSELFSYNKNVTIECMNFDPKLMGLLTVPKLINEAINGLNHTIPALEADFESNLDHLKIFDLIDKIHGKRLSGN